MTQLVFEIRSPGSSSQPLYGHTDSVTCLAVSEVHCMIVSGSRDLTCILWDAEELSYITQLTGHTDSISSVAINDLTVSLPRCHCCHGVFVQPWTYVPALLPARLRNHARLRGRVKLPRARGRSSTCGT